MKIRTLALASSLLLALNFACATTHIGKHCTGKQEYKQVKSPKNKYALLVLGLDTNVKVWNSTLKDKAVKVYDNLKELGFSDDRIYFLTNDRSEKIKGLDGSFTHHELTRICSELSEKMTEDDMLLFCYTGHSKEADVEAGDKRYALLKSVVEPDKPQLKTDELYIAELEKELKRLKYDHAVIIFDACMGGYFAKEVEKKNRVVISTACEDQTVWVFSEFVPCLTKALKGVKEADTNNDGKVSLGEAVDYAAEKDPWSKKKKGLKALLPEPQVYYENVNPSDVFLKE